MNRGLPLLLLALVVLAGSGASSSAGSGPVRIAFVSDRASAHADLYVMNADGTGQHRVTRTRTYSEQASTWSPDGLRIAFQTHNERNVFRGDAIAVMGRAGGIKLITNGAFQDDREPDWSPDGTRIAFARSQRNGYRIFTIRPNGTGLVQVTTGRFDRAPTWSPDSTHIAFTREGELWVVDADGGGATRIAAAFLSDPAWSPDGGTIAFTRASRRTGATDIYTIADGGGPIRQVTRTPSLSERFPSWSPDGRKIAYQFRAHPGDIYSMNANGTGAVRLATSPKDDALPSFTR